MANRLEKPKRATIHPLQRRVVLSAGLALALAACAGGVETGTDGTIDDRTDLVDALRERELTVEMAGSVEQPLFSVRGVLLRASGGGLSQPVELQSFEYDEAGQVDRALETIEPGVQGRTVHVSWLAPPHLYRAGRLLVLYIGEDEETLSLLREMLGAPVRQAE